MKFRAEIVEKTPIKDALGRVSGKDSTYEFKRQIWTDFIIPYNQDLAAKTFGFTLSLSHKTVTFDHVDFNEFIRVGTDIYKVVKVIKYPRSSFLFLELV